MASIFVFCTVSRPKHPKIQEGTLLMMCRDGLAIGQIGQRPRALGSQGPFGKLDRTVLGPRSPFQGSWGLVQYGPISRLAID